MNKGCLYNVIMEKPAVISTHDGKKIYGILRGSLDKPLLVFIHGFTGDMNQHLFFNGARFFEKKGISAFRFNLYSWREGARKLNDSPLSLLGKDLDTVISYFREKGVKKIFVAGHSFGGVTVLLSQKQDFDAAILWDSSGDKDVHLKAKYVKAIDKYLLQEGWAEDFTIGKEMYEENNKKLAPTKLIAKIKAPIKIIIAGAGEMIEDGNELFYAANEPKDKATIEGATHNFDEDGTEEKLFEETYKWIKRFV